MVDHGEATLVHALGVEPYFRKEHIPGATCSSITTASA